MLNCPATSDTTKQLPSGEKWPSTSWITGGAQEPRAKGSVSELENLLAHNREHHSRNAMSPKGKRLWLAEGSERHMAASEHTGGVIQPNNTDSAARQGVSCGSSDVQAS
jgi:hypothetical protein